MNRNDILQLSKTISRALRHEPWLYELELDEEGRCPVEQLLVALRKERPQWRRLAVADIEAMIDSLDKQRHELTSGYIRALYGHSLPGRLHKTPAVPPRTLYHGTAPDSLVCIRKQGLQPMGRHYVHLSVDTRTAVRVGVRKAKEPVVLCVTAEEAHLKGVRFYEGNAKVWLADHIPAVYLRICSTLPNRSS